MTLEVLTWLEKRRRNIGHRQLLVISGSQEWVKESITNILTAHAPTSSICVGDIDSVKNIESKQYRSVLGQEFEWVVYDGFADIRGNALLALSGCVSKGGLMILLCPELDAWSQNGNTQSTVQGLVPNTSRPHSPFIEWLVEHIKTFPGVSIWQQQQLQLTQAETTELRKSHFQDEVCMTADQFQLVEYIKFAYSKDNNQIVVLADRGRGKSSALGIAAGQLIMPTNTTFLVTSAHRSMTQKIFEQASKILKTNDPSRDIKQILANHLAYVPFDKIIQTQPKADWLFVDEAASLPSEVLEKLVQLYPNVVLSTTIHGYEGSGRGFELRFKPFLRTHFAHFREFMLHTPIRWFENDPLEAFWHKVMALKTTTQSSVSKRLTEYQSISNSSNELVYEVYNGAQLIKQPSLLQGVFELLVDAHYQTSPDDLVRMLDGDQHIHVFSNQYAEPIGVALTALEGGEDLTPIAIDIAQGSRRIPGHLIPQRLAFDNNNPEYLLKRYIRVIRIAVKQEYRHKKVGSQLLAHIQRSAEEHKVDFLGSSFGLTKELALFWYNNDFQLVKLGIKQDASSGEFSAIMLKPLSCNANQISKFLNLICTQQIHYQKDYRLKTLSPALVELIFNNLKLKKSAQPYDSHKMKMYWHNLMTQFIAGNRPLFAVEFAVFNWIKSRSINLQTLDEEAIHGWKFINDVIVAKNSYPQLCTNYKLAGKKQIESYFREQLKKLIKN
ncbi:GNAT family N-acetyltransferase [Alteromonas sp. M12]|uniref:GNAT family N-acetyltransferase n=1 Tax=Alteromonas sp. M12 TaxID=3135644 RepID=UPI00319E64AE